MSKLAWALYWASRGVPVFPIVPNGKDPAIADNLNQATIDPATINYWWTREPNYNVGAVPRNQVVADLDEKDGRHGIADAQRIGLDFDTLATRTPTNGLHLWYEGPPTANTVGLLPNGQPNPRGLAAGIDTRGPLGYLVMPGSTIDGASYTIANDAPIKPVQQFVLDILRAPRERTADQTPLLDLDQPSAIALAQRFLDETPGAVRGAQNDTTFRVACHLRDLGVSDTIAAELIDARWAIKCQPQIPSDEIDQIVANAYAYAQNAPGSKHPMVDFDGYRPPAEPPAQLELFEQNDFDVFGNMISINDLQPRDWLLKGFLERKAVSTILAPGGVGKSQFLLTLAAYLARGEEKFFGFRNMHAGKPARSIIINMEDDENEMSSRLHALCTFMGWDYREIKPYIALVSGRRVPMKLLTREGGKVVCTEKMLAQQKQLARACHKNDVVLVGIDPMTKLHDLNENDNIEMGVFMEHCTRMAEGMNVALVPAHHTAKMAPGVNYAGNASAGRGAGEITNGGRAAYTLSAPSQEDCNRFGIETGDAFRTLRLDNAKLNRSLGSQDALAWLWKESVNLANGEEVGCFVEADPTSNRIGVQQAMARTLDVEMLQKGGGSMPLAEAVDLLRRVDPIYSELNHATVRSRMERFLNKPVALENGHSVRIEMHSNKKLVVCN